MVTSSTSAPNPSLCCLTGDLDDELLRFANVQSVDSLFVAPVESAAPPKAASKNGVASPLRSGYRRLALPGSIERRNALRGSHSRNHDPHPRPSRPSQDGSLPRPVSPTTFDHQWRELRLRPTFQQFREGRQVRSRPTPPGRDTAEDLRSIFGDNWQGPSHDEQTVRAAYDRIFPAGRSRRAGPPLSSIPLRRATRSSQGGPHSNDLRLRANATLSGTSPTGALYDAWLVRNVRDRRGPAHRHGFDVDGLGDRERSMSPEVWDTLLTTLTPDPQPPSASSSFGSATVPESHGPGPMATIPALAMDIVNVGVPDGQCDSDCGHSDLDMDEDEDVDEDGIDVPGTMPPDSQTRTQTRYGRQHAAPYNLDSIMNGSLGVTSGSTGMSRRRAEPMVGDGISPRDAGRTSSDEMLPESRLPAGTARAPGHRDVVGSLFPWEASEDERGADERRLQPQASAASGQSNGVAGAEDDWSGMQRIVRSLARREDIPDDWWAEAGLSRMLPQDETTNA
ncbi:hypothetical protein DCS_01745 [Drechmeria coniospora]|uniref:Uncharacterized protein n=1 Tax=Drechmeria coniospora TaxID=98403 RepID=A0A151GU56_DRECN|nr:hypothetical protein DCS_01745 [Drechmeria coniospora]KYK60608.1 hypothetical protein DCS_01745 [Drechmeria coniospora]